MTRPRAAEPQLLLRARNRRRSAPGAAPAVAEMARSPSAVLLVAVGAGSFAFVRYDLYGHVVPALEGRPLGAAEASAQQAGLVARRTVSRYDAAVPAGRVIWQSIGQGRHERRGTVIDVSVSLGRSPCAGARSGRQRRSRRRRPGCGRPTSRRAR